MDAQNTFTFDDLEVGQIYKLKNVRKMLFSWSTPYVKITRLNKALKCFTAIDARPPTFRINRNGKRVPDITPEFCHCHYTIDDIHLQPLLDRETGIIQTQHLPIQQQIMY